MLNKNFYNFLLTYGGVEGGAYTLVDGSTRPVNAQNVSYYHGPWQCMPMYSGSVSDRGVCFGTGTTPPTADDYCLEKPITSGLIVTTPSAVTYNSTDEYMEYIATFGVTATNTVTITEIGLRFAPYWNTNDKCYAMVDRTVLENPIEIPAGQAKQITYTIRFNYHT